MVWQLFDDLQTTVDEVLSFVPPRLRDTVAQYKDFRQRQPMQWTCLRRQSRSISLRTQLTLPSPPHTSTRNDSKFRNNRRLQTHTLCAGWSWIAML